MFLGYVTGALGNSVTGTRTLSANLGANAKLSVVQPTVSLLHAGTTFANFTGAATVQYKVRTTRQGDPGVDRNEDANSSGFQTQQQISTRLAVSV